MPIKANLDVNFNLIFARENLFCINCELTVSLELFQLSNGDFIFSWYAYSVYKLTSST